MRAAFHHSLDEIGDILADMAEMAGAAMLKATQALLEADAAKAEEVIEGDDALDRLTGSVEQRCYDAIARHQPVATDLRTVITALQISSSLERMGDLAEHVAQLARIRGPQGAIPEELHEAFADMGRRCHQMAVETAEDIRSRDVDLAGTIAYEDDAVDALHDEVLEIVASQEWRHPVTTALDVMQMARHFERFADHTVTIARRVMQIVTGASYSDTAATLQDQ